MGVIRKFKPTSPSLRRMTVMTSQGLAKNNPIKKLTSAKKQKLVETQVELQFVTEVVELRENTELLILKDRKQISLQLLKQLSTIQTELVILLLSLTKMVRKHIF